MITNDVLRLPEGIAREGVGGKPVERQRKVNKEELEQGNASEIANLGVRVDEAYSPCRGVRKLHPYEG